MNGPGAIALDDPLTLPVATDRADALLQELAAGHEPAMRLAYRDHQAALRSFARRLVGTDAEAEDLVHEVFVRLPRAARRFRGEASLRTLLMAMAVNHARHHVRSAARRRAAIERLARDGQIQPPAPQDAAERQQLAHALMRALDGLPLEQRVAFVLCDVEERPSAEAAAIARTSDGTMRARLMLARRKLRAQMIAWGHGGDAAEAVARPAVARGRAW